MALEVKEFAEEDIGGVAVFLARTLGGDAATGDGFEAWLRWTRRKTGQGPPGTPAGWLLRDSGGEIVGFHLTTPYEYRVAGEARWGLVSSNLYVDESARGMPAFTLFKKFLVAMPEAVHWCSTANEISSALWEAVGGQRVDGSDREQVRINRLSPGLLAYAGERLLAGAGLVANKRGGPDKGRRERAVSRVREIDGFHVLDSGSRAEVTWPATDDGVVCDQVMVEWLLECPRRDILFGRYADWNLLLEPSRRGRGRGFPAISILAAWAVDGGSAGDPTALESLARSLTRRFSLCRLASQRHAPISSFEERKLSRFSRWVIASGGDRIPMNFPWNGLDEI